MTAQVLYTPGVCERRFARWMREVLRCGALWIQQVARGRIEPLPDRLRQPKRRFGFRDASARRSAQIATGAGPLAIHSSSNACSSKAFEVAWPAAVLSKMLQRFAASGQRFSSWARSRSHWGS